MSLGLLLVVIFLGGALAARLAEQLRCPGLLGMLAWGGLLGIFLKGQVSNELALLSATAKELALAVILLRLGLGIRLPLLRQTGWPSLLVGGGSCALEVGVLSLILHSLFDWSWPLAGLTACMLAAISPAVVVPAMLDLLQRGYGSRRAVPTMLLSATSLDNLVAIFSFSVLLGVISGHSGPLLLSIPVACILGTVPGMLAGWFLGVKLRPSAAGPAEQLLVLLSVAVLLLELGNHLNSPAVLGVTAMGLLLQHHGRSCVESWARMLDRVWFFAQILLFVLIGLNLNPATTLDIGWTGGSVIVAGVLCRLLGVWLMTYFTALNRKERLFCAVSFVPRATAQAALGGVALAQGIPEGEWIQALSVLAIVLTAPTGAVGIRLLGHRLLEPESASHEKRTQEGQLR